MRSALGEAVRASAAQWRPGLHGVGGSAAAALSIPGFAPEGLPRYSGDESYRRKLAGLAITLAQRGLLTKGDCEQGMSEGISFALSRWLAQTFSGLRCFEFKAHLFSDAFEACGVERDEFLEAHSQARMAQAFEEACDLDVESQHVAIGLYAASSKWLLVGEGIERLEAAHPGLGWTVLHEIQDATIDFNLFDFGWIEQAASYTYWCGGDDECELLDMYGEDGERYEGVTRAQFDEAVPARVMRQAKRLSTRAVMGIGKNGGSEAARISNLICRLRRLKNTQPICRISALEGEFDWFDSLEPTVVLGWKSWDLVNRLTDDYAEIMYNGDACLRDVIAVMPIPLADGKGLANLEMKWRGPIKRLRYADRLVSLLSGQEE